MATTLTESVIAEAAAEWLGGLGYQYLPGRSIACDLLALRGRVMATKATQTVLEQA